MGLIGTGLALGATAFGTFTGGLLMARQGWRPVFILFGLWPRCCGWSRGERATREASIQADTTPRRAPPPSFLSILKVREAWGAGLGHFAVNGTFYFVITWLPLYLVKTRGFSLSQMAELGGLIYVIYAISAQATGWLSDPMDGGGVGDTRVRKTFFAWRPRRAWRPA